MADTVALNKVLLGDTTAEVVEKINKGLKKTDNNETSIASIESAVNALEDAVATAGKVDDVKVNGESVVTEKVANITVPTKVSELNNDSGYIPSTEKGAKNGIATLDENGLVPSSQLPSYVDDVVEYDNFFVFPTTGETGKIYLDLDTNKQYRWGGTQYVEISSSLALGTTSSTAFYGDRGLANENAIKEIQDNYVARKIGVGNLSENGIVLGAGTNSNGTNLIRGTTYKIKTTSTITNTNLGSNNSDTASDEVILTGAVVYSLAQAQFRKFIVNSNHFNVVEDDNYKTYTAKSASIQYGYPLSLVNADGKPLVAELYMNSNNYAVIVVDKSKDLFTTNTYVYVRFLGA